MAEKGKTFIVSGPSGVGKSSILRRVFEHNPNLYFSVSATTRAPRPGEVDGKDYHFIDADRFRRMIEDDQFLEHAEFVGSCYGTPKEYVDAAMAEGRDVILDIEISGVQQVCAKRPEVVSIYVAPPSWDALEQRLTGRGTDSAEKIHGRLERAKVDFRIAADIYDYFVINDDIDRAVKEIEAILLAEHCRMDERVDSLKQ